MTDIHRAKRETVKEAGIQSLDTATDMLQNARISNSTKACTGLVNTQGRRINTQTTKNSIA